MASLNASHLLTERPPPGRVLSLRPSSEKRETSLPWPSQLAGPNHAQCQFCIWFLKGWRGARLALPPRIRGLGGNPTQGRHVASPVITDGDQSLAGMVSSDHIFIISHCEKALLPCFCFILLILAYSVFLFRGHLKLLQLCRTHSITVHQVGDYSARDF